MDAGVKKAKREVKQKLLNEIAAEFPTASNGQIKKLAQQVVSGRVPWPTALAAISQPELVADLGEPGTGQDVTLGN